LLARRSWNLAYGIVSVQFLATICLLFLGQGAKRLVRWLWNEVPSVGIGDVRQKLGDEASTYKP
jgi:hypothetical protein